MVQVNTSALYGKTQLQLLELNPAVEKAINEKERYNILIPFYALF